MNTVMVISNLFTAFWCCCFHCEKVISKSSKEICMYIKPWNLIPIFVKGGLYENLNNILLVFTYFMTEMPRAAKMLCTLKKRFSEKCQNSISFTAWKVRVFGVVLVRIFPHLYWIQRDTSYLPLFSPNAGK